MYYQKLKKLYYEMFPDEKKLEFGSIFWNEENFSCTFCVLAEGVNELDVSKAYCLEHEKPQFIKEILGKDIDIREVLLLLECNRELCKRKYDIDTKGYLTVYDFDPKKGYPATDQLYLDLSKPLKEQDEKVLKEIYNLIKN